MDTKGYKLVVHSLPKEGSAQLALVKTILISDLEWDIDSAKAALENLPFVISKKEDRSDLEELFNQLKSNGAKVTIDTFDEGETLYSESIEQIIEIDIDEFISTPELTTEDTEEVTEEIIEEDDGDDDDDEFSIDIQPLAKISRKKDAEKELEIPLNSPVAKTKDILKDPKFAQSAESDTELGLQEEINFVILQTEE